jgi:hypothetical protein
MHTHSQVAPDEEFDWAARYQGALRTVPLAAGALGILGVLVNRLLSGVSKAGHPYAPRSVRRVQS